MPDFDEGKSGALPAGGIDDEISGDKSGYFDAACIAERGGNCAQGAADELWNGDSAMADEDGFCEDDLNGGNAFDGFEENFNESGNGADEANAGTAPDAEMLAEVIERLSMEHSERELEKDFAQLRKIEPSIKSMKDLCALPEYPEILRLVSKNGLDLVSAYKIAGFENILKNRQSAARQAAINAAASKGHFTRTPGGGAQETGLEIPADAVGTWRAMFPEESDAKLRARYNAAIRPE